MTRALVLLMVIAAVSLQQAKVAPVVVIVRAPSIVYDDESIVIQVRVDPRTEHRLLVVGAWEGDTSLRTSLEQLDGEDSPRTRWVRWSRLAAGDLELRAYVFGEGGQLGMARQKLQVLARWQ